MSVGNTPRRAGPFTGTGSVTQYPFSFRIFSPSELTVLRSVDETTDAADETLAYGSDYTVELNDDQNTSPGGVVTLAAPLASGLRLAIVSAVPSTQTITITNYDGMQPELLNTAHDKLTILIQQLEERTDRTLLIPGSSSETPEELMQRLLSAQEEAQESANIATGAKDEAQAILDDVKEYGQAATVVEPISDEIVTVATNINSVKATGGNITSVNIVAGDLDTATLPVDWDYGDYDTNTGSGTAQVAIGGNIKTVADNISQVNTVATNMASILAIEGKIDGLDVTIETMNQQVAASTANAESAEGSATASANSATVSASQADLAQAWAIKLDGKVIEGGAEVDFSSKYWAQQAASSATSAEAALTSVTQAGESAVADIQSAQSTAVQAVSSQQSTSVNAVTQAQTTAVNAVRNQQTTSVDAVNTAGSQQTANAKAQADAAAASASAASDSADSASSSATSAATSASTATTQATTATTQAGLATTAKDDAVAARDAAQTAQAAAEAAQASAEEIAGSLGDPLGKEEAAATYATKTELSTKANTADLGALASLDTVATAQINNYAVTNAKLANNSIGASKIADGVITPAKLATEFDLGDYDG